MPLVYNRNYSFWILIFSSDTNWRDLFESTNTLTRISATEISGHHLVEERDEGKYGCEISNGIAPSLWTEFMIKISGKFIFLLSNEPIGAFEFYFKLIDFVQMIFNKVYNKCNRLSIWYNDLRVKLRLRFFNRFNESYND